MSDLKWESPGQRQLREQDAQQAAKEIQQLLAKDREERLTLQRAQENTDHRRFVITTVLMIFSLVAAVVAAIAAVLPWLV